MEKGQGDDSRVARVIVEVASEAIDRLSAATRCIASDKRERTKADDALTRRIIRSIATSETIRSNCRAAMTSPRDIDDAEEAAMLARAQRMLARVLAARWPKPSSSAPN